MGLLQVIDDAPGYVKATFQGPQGSGKTRTAVELATMAHKFFASQKPVAFFDTETGSDYIAKLIEERTGMKPLRVKTRAFSALREAVRECVAGAADVLVVDSITHVWRELQDAYMRKANEGRRWPKTRMDIQDIMGVKKVWEPWPDDFLNSPVHMIVCGREGNEWGSQEDEQTGKREMVAVGKKMKVEADFGYEASLMISMHAEQVAATLVKKKDRTTEKRPRQLINVMTVLKDRFDVMNGQAFEMPDGNTFLPFLKLLRPQAHGAVDVAVRSDAGLPGLNDDGWAREKREREVALGEVEAELTSVWAGQSAQAKQAKGEALAQAFGTRSWTTVEHMSAAELRPGLEKVKAIVAAERERQKKQGAAG